MEWAQKARPWGKKFWQQARGSIFHELSQSTMLNMQLSKKIKHTFNRNVGCQDFDRVLKQYRIGRMKPLKLNLKKYGDSFTHLLFTQIESRFSYAEWNHFQQLSNVRENALMAVRRRDFDVAERLFRELRIPFRFNSLSPEGKLLHQTFLEQAQAYLDYCKGDFEGVYSRMFDALAIDTVLEEDYGYKIMAIHRIQLLYNLVRTEARCGCFDRAMEIASTLLGYLQGTIENLCLFESFGRECLNYQSKEILADTFSLITSEIALILAGKATHRANTRANHLLAIALQYLEVSATAENSLHQPSYQWFLLKQAMVNNNIPLFLNKAGCFLASGRADTPLLWYATVVDLFTISKKFDFPSTQLIIEEVKQDAPKWELCSKQLLAFIK